MSQSTAGGEAILESVVQKGKQFETQVFDYSSSRTCVLHGTHPPVPHSGSCCPGKENRE